MGLCALLAAACAKPSARIDGTLTDADMIMEYVQNHMNAKIGEEYANWQGQGRITIIK